MKQWLMKRPTNSRTTQRFSSVLSMGLAVLGLLSGQPVKALDFTLPEDANVVAKWNQATLEAIGDAQLYPTSASRVLAIVHDSIFEAWAAYDPVAIGPQLGDELQVSGDRITQENKREAVSYAAYHALVELFPSQVGLFNDLMNDLGYDAGFTTTDRLTEAGIGRLSARSVLDFRHDDGANYINGYEDITGYQPINTDDRIVDPNLWQALKVDNGQTEQAFITPQWGNVTPFALASGDEFLPPPPPAFGSPEYLNNTLEVIEYNAALDDRGKVLAEYWADGPGTVQPAGHWHLFAQYVSDRDGHTLDDDAKMFFILGNATLDAGISAWYAKVYYNYVRPITAIRYLAENEMLPEAHPYVRTNPQTEELEIFSWAGPDRGQEWVTGSEWMPYQKISFVSPAFAEYVSGHSTFSTAAAEVLKRYTGSDNFGARHTQAPYTSTYESSTPEQPVMLSWPTFTDAANESGISRLYGGIHFQPGDLNGRTMGRLVGDRVWERSQYYIDGGS
ncbi:vanadium-dependent haloperoxidase [Oscillatoriales cyanobacterium LEGE 11467]|uniref:Vanadium-dependent haloperoxidase n=1 Tax=Zarconia navalis LEGE 11467 TaxID=1828826 RepID=A0A928ZBK1_9CYAN|nr:vanadium-dependent haloperoxidase [Zarconia navalis]MBE9042761.1 vanadium-dependent haloperoxidase [Zarconia navalis LEGE 11467]